jgi:hypothetical protein
VLVLVLDVRPPSRSLTRGHAFRTVRAMRAVVLSSVLLLAPACAFPAPTEPAPPHVPAYAIDEKASEVVLDVTSGEGDPVKVRQYVTEILSDMNAERPATGPAQPARYKVTVRGKGDASALASCGIFPIPMGVFVCLPGFSLTRNEYVVDVDLEVGGQVLHGRGDSKRLVSAYFNGTGYQSLKEALGNALRASVPRTTAQGAP